MFDRRYLEDRLVDALPATFRLMENALQELQLVFRGPRMLPARLDHVLDFTRLRLGSRESESVPRTSPIVR